MHLAKRTLVAGTTGIVSLATLSSVAFAQDGSSSSSSAPNITACAAALGTQEAIQLSAMDALLAAQKKALQTRTTAFRSALSLSESGGRNAAVKSAEDTFRAAMNAATTAYRDSVSPGADTLKASCAGLGNGIIGAPTSPVELKVQKEDKKVFQAKVVRGPKAVGMKRKLRDEQAKAKSARSATSSRSSSSSTSTAQ